MSKEPDLNTSLSFMRCCMHACLCAGLGGEPALHFGWEKNFARKPPFYMYACISSSMFACVVQVMAQDATMQWLGIHQCNGSSSTIGVPEDRDTDSSMSNETELATAMPH